MDENVSKSVERFSRLMQFAGSENRSDWQTIRARLVELEAENARLRKDADDDRKGYGKLLSAFHKSKTRLATANALLRECVHFIDYGGAADDELAEKIAAHLSENGHE